MERTKVARVGDIPEGEMTGVETELGRVLVARVDGSFHAISAKCSHMGGDLTKGELTNGIVKCPRHGAQYDVRTGQLVKDVGGIARAINLGRGATGQQPYRVVVEGDDVMIEF